MVVTDESVKRWRKRRGDDEQTNKALICVEELTYELLAVVQTQLVCHNIISVLSASTALSPILSFLLVSIKYFLYYSIMIVQSSAAVSNMLTLRKSHNCFVPKHSEISHQNHAHDAKAVPKARHPNYTSL